MTEKRTQAERIYTFLRMNEGLCAMQPINWRPPIVRVAARIYDLRQMGYVIDAFHRCPEHQADHAYYQLAGGRLF